MKMDFIIFKLNDGTKHVKRGKEIQNIVKYDLSKSDRFTKQTRWKNLLKNLEGFTTIANKMEKHIQNWMKKLKQSSGINILQVVNGLNTKIIIDALRTNYSKTYKILSTEIINVHMNHINKTCECTTFIR